MTTEITVDILSLIDRIKNIEESIEQLKNDIKMNTQLPKRNSEAIYNLTSKHNQLVDKVKKINSEKEPEKPTEKKRKFW